MQGTSRFVAPHANETTARRHHQIEMISETMMNGGTEDRDAKCQCNAREGYFRAHLSVLVDRCG